MMAAIRKSRGEARARLLREMNGVPDGYLTTGGAAAYLGVTHAAVWLAYQKGRLDGEQFGNLACFTQAALDAYAACRRERGIALPASPAVVPAEQAEVPAMVQETEEAGQEPARDAALPAVSPESPAPASPVPCARVQTRYTWSDVQAMALVGKTKKLALSGGGLLYLCYDVDLFTLSERERNLLFALIDAIQQFEEEQQ